MLESFASDSLALLVQDKLQCSQEEVENWIVKAIGRRLLEARIDQLQRLVTITRTTQRTFSQKDWARLSAQLKIWQVCCPGEFTCAHASTSEMSEGIRGCVLTVLVLQGTVEDIKESIATHNLVPVRA